MNIEEARERIKELELVYQIQYSILEYDNCIKNKEALELVLNELDKKDKIIDMMSQHIYENTYRDLEECEFEEYYQIQCKKNCKECAKEYFYNKVENID